MRRQLKEDDRTPLYGAFEEEYTLFSREAADSNMTVHNGVLENAEKEKETERKLKYPKSVFFIISNEFCERFSYYGMRSVLSLYLKDALHYDENTSTIIYHVFVMLCYFTPLFGGIMADAWLGKFKTILYVSLIYATGNIVLSFGSVEALSIPHKELSLLGLFLIALGTGGIKPCVSSFGGDQFVLPEQTVQLERFFSVFYFSINAGSVISSFLMPIFREYHCLGSTEDCYPLAFGLPAALMIIATVIFVCGSPMYKKSKAQGNVAVNIGGCVSHAVARRIGSSEKKDHWLDYAEDKYNKKLIDDIKVLMKLIFLFSPTIVFWALFEQQGSKWTFQATRMNGDLGGYVVQPDQMQTLNAVLVLVFIPLFQSIVYPLLAKLRLVRTPLQKLCVGGFLAAVAFVISGFLEIKIEADNPSLPGSGQSHLQLFNGYQCEAEFAGGLTTRLPDLSHLALPDLPAKNLTVKISGSCFKDIDSSIVLNDEQVSSYFLLPNDENLPQLFPLNLNGKDELIKGDTTFPKVKIIFSGLEAIDVVLSKDDNYKFSVAKNSHQSKQMKVAAIGKFGVNVTGDISAQLPDITLAQGGIYTLLLSKLNGKMESKLFVITSPNTVNILWQIPQYIVITSAEIMFSITGLEFSYSESPSSLKSVISSLWLLTDALGNVIILIIESAALSNKIMEFFIYAAVMSFAMLLFTFLAMRYQYRTAEEKSADSNNLELEEHTKI